MTLTKAQVMRALGLDTEADLATFFGTSRQAVHQWADDAPIPEGRQWQARAKRPDLWPNDNDKHD